MRWSDAPHVVRGKNVVLPDGVAPAAIILEKGRIERVTAWDDTGFPGADVLDVDELFVMPGLVDTHVHINDPGRAEWEGFATATAAAAAGGVTTLLDMPLNSVPATTNVKALERKRRAAEGKLRVDVGFLGGVVPGNEAHLKPLWDAGVFGFKCFLVPSGVDEFRNVTAADLDKAMPVLAKLDATLMAHCELTEQIVTRDSLVVTRTADPRAYATYLASRPPKAEADAVQLMIDMARKHNARAHVVHVSSAESVALLRSVPGEFALTAETCPHYLAIDASEIADGATEFKCAPPIRDKSHQDALWKGLLDDTLSMIVSDHSPCPPSAKRKDIGDFFAAWGGIASLELGLSVVCTEMRRRAISPHHMGNWMAKYPAWLCGLDHLKGQIKEGLDADLAIFDPYTKFTVDAATLQQRHKLTPYHGRELVGKVVATYMRGKLIYADGKLVGGPSGRLLSRTS